MHEKEFLWVEKYRPKKVDDCVLTSDLKTAAKKFVENRKIPNLLLSGGPGVGKTTLAKAMLTEIDADYYMINGSMNGNIDTLRHDIQQYASSVSFTSERKYVILDEADYLNPQSTQPALRNFMEEFSDVCGFILTCNFKNRIIGPLHSRCSVIEFNIPKKDRPELAQDFFKRLSFILKEENVTFDPKAVAKLITKFFPDWRRVINEVQRYSAISNHIDDNVLTATGNNNVEELVNLLKNKKFDDMRKWVSTNTLENSSIYRALYDVSSHTMKKESIPQLIITLADYQYKESFCADPELNLMACLTEVMADCEFE
jgi:DNA polymerase III delta prime subunit